MGKDSKIAWTQDTWNPWQGCRKVSPGCKYCYMYRDKARYGQSGREIYLSTDKTINKPLYIQEPRLIFTCSWSDFFIEEADLWRAAAWKIIRATPQHTYQILTKRPERIRACLPADWGEGYPNVWLGVSVENFDTYVERYAEIIQVPAKVRFLSAEPLLNDLTIEGELLLAGIHWVIIGGESGNGIIAEDPDYKFGYRQSKIGWYVKLIAACKAAGVAVFVKQLGTHLAKRLGMKDRAGGDIEEWPGFLRVREMPENGGLANGETP